uniref:ABC transporter permease n=1 Tax=Angiostrongylus cantonensis TaxID=6313 RepID=A0A0K0DPF4_ANGCA
LYSATFGFGLFLIFRGTIEPMNVPRVLYAISFTARTLGFATYVPEYIKATFAAGLIFSMLQEER